MLENDYSKLEYERLLNLQQEWISTPLKYDNVVNVVIEIGLFKSTYQEKFPKSKEAINQDRHFLRRINLALFIFDRYITKENSEDDELKKAFNNIGLAFQSLLFNMKYGDLMETKATSNLVV